MREIVRLALTLLVVGVVSAAVLTGVNNWTAPIIEERRESEYLAAVAEYFPEVKDVETIVDDNGDFFDLIYDSSGNLLGVVGTIQQAGYEGFITYNLAVNADGVIVGLRVISHSETPGIGDVIERDSFIGQFLGKSHEDPLQPGTDVDLVSGASVSTSAMIGSVRRTVGDIAFSYLDFEEEIFEIALVPDGTYQGSAPGLMGDILVEVVVEGGRITAIEVLENEETPTYFVMAYPLIPELIIEEQQLEVDTLTGATASAEGIVNAVRNALEAALEEEVDPDDQGGGEDDE